MMNTDLNMTLCVKQLNLCASKQYKLQVPA